MGFWGFGVLGQGLKTKIKNTGQFYTNDDQWIENTYNEDFVFDYGNAERLIKFNETHPLVFQERVKRVNWKFTFDPTELANKLDFRRKVLGKIEDLTGVRLFSYKNYKRIK